MKRKLIIPFAVLTMFIGLSACNGQGGNGGGNGGDTSKVAENEIKITFSAASKKLVKGEKGTFTCNVEGVTWSSDKTDVATVNDKGEVTAVGEGKAVIKASKAGYKDATETITVVLKKIGITSADNKKTMIINEQLQLTADVAGATWSSSDAKIATVDNSGKVTAVGAGEVTIYAEAQGFAKGSFPITVSRPDANATLDFLTDSDHYSADGWWEVGGNGFFSTETCTGYTPEVTPSPFGGSSEEADPYIGGFGAGDKETIKFNSSKANPAEFLVNMGNADAITLSEVMTVKLNGTALDLANIALEAHQGQWGNTMTFDDISLGKATLRNGENTLVFEFLADGAPRLNTLSIYAGDATITKTAPAAKSQITVQEAELSVIEGETVQIVTTEAGVSYTSVDETIAAVNASGVVTGVKSGITEITVKKEGMYSVRVKITVSPRPVAGQIIVEAEDATELQGDEKPQNVNVTADGQGWGGSNIAHSGGKYVASWGASDVTLSYTFTATQAQQMVMTIVGNGPMSMGGEASPYVTADSMGVKFNDADLTLKTEETLAAGSMMGGVDLDTAILGTVNVKNGTNTFSVTFNGSMPSFDCFKFTPLA